MFRSNTRTTTPGQRKVLLNTWRETKALNAIRAAEIRVYFAAEIRKAEEEEAAEAAEKQAQAATETEVKK